MRLSPALWGWLVIAPPTEAPDETGLALEWRAAPSCPARRWVVEATRRYLGGRLPSQASRLLAEAVIEREDDGSFRLELELVLGELHETREVGADSCEELAAATALVLAVTLDPNAQIDPSAIDDADATEREAAAATETDPEPDPEPEPDPDPEPESDPEPAQPEPSPAGDRERAWTGTGPGQLRATALAELGALPRVTLGFVGQLAYAWARARLEARGQFSLPRSRALESGGSLTLWHAFGGVRSAYRLFAGPVEFPLGGGLEAGALIPRFAGIRMTSDAPRAWIAASLAAGVIYSPIAQLGLVLDVEAAFPLLRPTFSGAVAGEPVDLFRPAWISGRLHLGLELRFP